jgi:transcriptional regulator with XRE-family HTH domain/tetratricopeptide (TPR) repeat protein
MATARWQPNRQLRARREALGWSRARLAHQVNRCMTADGLAGTCTSKHIEKWECGHRRPSELFRGFLAAALGCELADLGLEDGHNAAVARLAADSRPVVLLQLPEAAVELVAQVLASFEPAAAAGEPGTGPGGASVERRTFTLGLGAALMEFSTSLRHSNVGERTLADLEAKTAGYAADYPQVAPGQLIGPVRQSFDVVRRCLAERQPIGQRRRLCRTAARLGAIAGLTLFNLGDTPQARWAFRAAMEAAREAEDDVLAAWVLASNCIIPTYSDDPWGVLGLTRRGLGLAAGSSSAVVAKLAALEAKAHARLGNEAAASDALRQATRAMGSAPAEELRPGAFGFPPAKHLYYEGTSYVRLGASDRALASSTEALALYRPTRAYMDTAIVNIDLAVAQAQKGELDRACALVAGVLDLPSELRIRPMTARVREFLGGLGPAQSTAPAVRELRERLAHLRSSERGGS